VIDSAIEFDGVDDFVDVGDAGVNLNSIAFWFKPTSDTEKILDLDGGTHSVEIAAGTISATGFVAPTIHIDGVATTTISAGEWNFVAITTTTSFAVDDFDIGRNSTNYFTGDIDDVKIWDTALTASEIQSEFTRGRALHLDDGLVGWWKLDESPSGAADEIQDFSGNANHGTSAGTMTSADSVSGKLGNALDFDGVDDFVDIGSTGQTVNTASFWIFADDISRGIVDFDGGTHSVEVAAGTITATGFDTPTIFVDGVAGSTISADEWHFISITTATGFTATDLKIGKETTFFDGKIDDFKIYSRALSAAEISALYRTRVATTNSLDDFPNDYPADDSTDQLPDGRSYFHIRPLTGAGTFGDERNFSVAYSGRAPTIDPDSIKIYKNDGTTEVPEGNKIVGESAIKIKPEITNFNSTAVVLTVFHNLIDTASDFVSTFTPTTEDADGLGNPACVSGVDYDDCDSKVWYEMSASGDYSSTAFNPTVAIDGLPNDNYRVRIVASNDSMSNVLVDYGESEGVGWLSSHHSDIGEGAFYTASYLDGWIFSETAGWIKLRSGNPTTTTCATQPIQTATDYGVMHDGSGNLCGYGYSESLGWVSFMGTGYQVSIESDHSLTGYATSETVGWVGFD